MNQKLFYSLLLILLAALLILGWNSQWTSHQTLVFQVLVLFSVWAAGKVSFQIPVGLRGLFRPTPLYAVFSLGVLFYLSLALLIWVNRSILLGFFNSGDEHSCHFFAQCLLKGKWWAEPHPLSDFFEVTHLGIKDGKWFSVYPPGWPLVWSLAMKWNLKDWINPLLASASLIVFAQIGEKVYSRNAAWPAVISIFISPFFLLTSASYYSHALCLFLIGIFILSFVYWSETRHSLWALLAGLALGFGLATRYLTMGLMAFPFVIYAGFQVFRKKWAWNKGVFLFLGAVFVLLGLHSGYNFLITGSFFDAPNHYLQSHEKLGFIAGYTPATALQYLIQRILYLTDWVPPLFVPLFLVSLFSKTHQHPHRRLIKCSVIFLMLGYMLYYSWGGNQYGPRYFYEGYPLMALLAADFAFEMWDDAEKKRVVVFFALSWILTLPLLGKHFSFYQKVSSERKAAYEKVEKETEKPAIVFLKGFLGDSLVMAPDDTVRNHPFFEEAVVYAADKGNRNQELLPYFPDHHCYVASYDRTRLEPVLERCE